MRLTPSSCIACMRWEISRGSTVRECGEAGEGQGHGGGCSAVRWRLRSFYTEAGKTGDGDSFSCGSVVGRIVGKRALEHGNRPEMGCFQNDRMIDGGDGGLPSSGRFYCPRGSLGPQAPTGCLVTLHVAHVTVTRFNLQVKLGLSWLSHRLELPLTGALDAATSPANQLSSLAPPSSPSVAVAELQGST